jgi:hydroxymethylglutaryl-CoA lyase
MTARAVEVVEVAPRDGLQNEQTLVPTSAKLELIERCRAAGASRVESVSFVHPERVPQMADAEEVAAGLPAEEGAVYSALVLNERGMERAVAAGIREVNAVVVATDTFSQRNQGTTIEEGLAVWRRIAAQAKSAGVRTTVTIAAAFGCPFEGEVSANHVISLAARVAEDSPDEIALADTIGVGVPRQVTMLLDGVRTAAPGVRLRCHFHNTRNTGLANAYAAVEAGVDALDASVGGIGGCPFAPAATGNIPTEDLAYMLARMGVETGLSLPSLIETAEWIGEQLGETVPGMLSRAGVFPSS